MAGIRGAKNPFPTKEKTASGVFVQRATAGPFSDKDTKSYAHGGDRKGPVARDNGLKRGAGKSHYTNMGLKRGTAQ
jgi:hypothetical protein